MCLLLFAARLPVHVQLLLSSFPWSFPCLRSNPLYPQTPRMSHLRGTQLPARPHFVGALGVPAPHPAGAASPRAVLPAPVPARGNPALSLSLSLLCFRLNTRSLLGGTSCAPAAALSSPVAPDASAALHSSCLVSARQSMGTLAPLASRPGALLRTPPRGSARCRWHAGGKANGERCSTVDRLRVPRLLAARQCLSRLMRRDACRSPILGCERSQVSKRDALLPWVRLDCFQPVSWLSRGSTRLPSTPARGTGHCFPCFLHVCIYTKLKAVVLITTNGASGRQQSLLQVLPPPF
jgi:hypothetical protein